MGNFPHGMVFENGGRSGKGNQMYYSATERLIRDYVISLLQNDSAAASEITSKMTEHVMTEMRDDEEVIAAIVAAATSRMVRP
ncbi:hypothetical protein P2L35_13475 [Enterococcus faecium]|uniref:hypothetical protein n=1 Tax=Enterococcus faecium TaxID=1352 RepID=UPI0025B24AA2|nr:hypothetical protein [Enterococcus faecium]MDN3040705.1 hypothetical protein [Enterococcus faecium]